MSRGKWIRCPHTGLALTAITYLLPDADGKLVRIGRLGDDSEGAPVQNDDGTLRTELFPDCNIYSWADMCRAATGGKTPNIARIKRRMIADPRCHFYGLGEDDEGNPLAALSHVNSVDAWREWDRAERDENSRRNLKRGSTSVSSSTQIISADVALVEKT